MENYNIYRMASDVRNALDRLVQGMASESEQAVWKAARLEEDNRRLRSELDSTRNTFAYPPPPREVYPPPFSPPPNDNLNVEMDSLRFVKSKLEEEVEKLKRELSQATSRAELAEARSVVSGDDDASSKKFDHFSKQVAILQDENKRLIAQLQREGANKDTAGNLASKLSREEAKSASLQTELNTLRGYLKEKDERLNEANSKLASLASANESSSSEAKKEVERLQENVSRLEEELRVSREEVNKKNHEIASHRKDMENIGAKLNEASTKAKEAVAAQKAAEAKQDLTRREHDGTILSLRDRQKEVAQLKELIQGKESRLTHFRMLFTQTKDELKIKSEECDRLKSLLEDIEAKSGDVSKSSSKKKKTAEAKPEESKPAEDPVETVVTKTEETKREPASAEEAKATPITSKEAPKKKTVRKKSSKKVSKKASGETK